MLVLLFVCSASLIVCSAGVIIGSASTIIIVCFSASSYNCLFVVVECCNSLPNGPLLFLKKKKKKKNSLLRQEQGNWRLAREDTAHCCAGESVQL